MAITSLSAANRLKPSNTPTSTAMGIVTIKNIGQDEENDLDHADKAGAVVYHHLQNARQLLHEENEGEDHAPDQSVGEDFAEDVAGQDAHGKALE